jgi:hypothetical protein
MPGLWEQKLVEHFGSIKLPTRKTYGNNYSSALLFHEACLTPELTGRAHNTDRFKLTIKDMLTRAPVQ